MYASVGNQRSSSATLTLCSYDDAFFSYPSAKVYLILASKDFFSRSAKLFIGQDFFCPPLESLQLENAFVFH
jgi:hypothetical protein